MKTKCKFCGVSTVNPCKTEAEVKAYVDKGLPLSRCASAHERIKAAPAAALPTEDAFALPQNGELSATAKAQIALGSLSGFAAPSPFEWGLMKESAARQALGGLQVRTLELRPEDLGHGFIPSPPAVSKTEGVKFDDGKLRFDLLPPDALAVVAAVMTYGALKYADRNWELGMDRARLRAARDRHMNARLLGQSHDPDTELPHVAHEAACALMELSLILRDKGSDTAAEIPEASRAAVEKYGMAAVRNGRLAAAKKGAQHG